MLKILHTGIVVRDMEESLRFYTDIMGFVKTGGHEMPGIKLAFLQGENQALELLEFDHDKEQKKQGMISHFAVAVDDMHAEIARLKENGVKLQAKEIRELEGMKFFSLPDQTVNKSSLSRLHK